jgi:hypothetical protein
MRSLAGIIAVFESARLALQTAPRVVAVPNLYTVPEYVKLATEMQVIEGRVATF